MNFVSPVLWQDATLFCATAYGENGQTDFLADPGTL